MLLEEIFFSCSAYGVLALKEVSVVDQKALCPTCGQMMVFSEDPMWVRNLQYSRYYWYCINGLGHCFACLSRERFIKFGRRDGWVRLNERGDVREKNLIIKFGS